MIKLLSLFSSLCLTTSAGFGCVTHHKRLTNFNTHVNSNSGSIISKHFISDKIASTLKAKITNKPIHTTLSVINDTTHAAFTKALQATFGWTDSVVVSSVQYFTIDNPITISPGTTVQFNIRYWINETTNVQIGVTVCNSSTLSAVDIANKIQNAQPSIW